MKACVILLTLISPTFAEDCAAGKPPGNHSMSQKSKDDAMNEYCYHPDCPLRNMHTMCVTAGKFSPRLYASGLTSWMRYQLLLLHNRHRDNVALGLEPGQPPAANMRKLYWDKELELSAEAWARQCPARHDECRNTLRFPVAQNLDVRPVVGWMSEAQVLSDAVASWFSGARAMPPDRVWSYLPANCSGPAGCLANRYSAAAWGSTWRIGCSQALCQLGPRTCEHEKKDINENTASSPEVIVQRTTLGTSQLPFVGERPAVHRGAKQSAKTVEKELRIFAHTVCNYGPAGNLEGLPVYTAGKACALCPHGTLCGDKTHRALCAFANDPELDMMVSVV